MPDVPPTTSEGMLDDDALYREQYGEEPDEPAICGAEKSDGSECQRLAEECQYH